MMTASMRNEQRGRKNTKLDEEKQTRTDASGAPGGMSREKATPQEPFGFGACFGISVLIIGFFAEFLRPTYRISSS
jgi:hypothetical protein